MAHIAPDHFPKDYVTEEMERLIDPDEIARQNAKLEQCIRWERNLIVISAFAFVLSVVTAFYAIGA